MLVKIFGGAVYGINALTITIEVNILWGKKASNELIPPSGKSG